MTASVEREHFIPVRKNELVEVLAAEPDLTREEREQFHTFCRRLGDIYHSEYHQRLERLKAAYGAFDPDADTRSLLHLSAADKQERLNALFREMAMLLEEANYTHLSTADLEPTLNQASEWGLKMDVDFRVFEKLALFARGISSQKRPVRRLRRALRRQEVEVPIYQRLVMVMKLRPHQRLGRQVDSASVYLQLFKNIPRLDVNMLLPGARARMNYLDRSRIGFTLLTGLALTAWQIAFDVVGAVANSLADFLLYKPAAFIWAAATGTLGYGVKTYFGYQQTRRRYNLHLAQILYYQNLDTNAGVLFRLLDEAEEQDCREAFLAFYCLWRHAGDKGFSRAELEQHVVQDLVHQANLQIAFEHHGCLAKLERLHVVEKWGDRYRARPLEQALAALTEACP